MWLLRASRLVTAVAAVLFQAGSATAQPPPTLTTVPRGEAFAERDDVTLLPAGESVLIIPEAAYNAALDRSDLHRTEVRNRDRAVAIVAIGNEPNALGIVGDLRSSPTPIPFAGSLFLVARNAAVAFDGRTLQADSYFVVAGSLSGTTPWLATDARMAMGAVASVTGRNCCGPATVCVEAPSPAPCEASGGLCAGPMIGVTRGTPGPLAERLNAGRGPIGMSILDDRRSRPNGIPPRWSQAFNACSRTVLPGCAAVTPVCSPGDTGYIGSGSGSDYGAGSSACGASREPGAGYYGARLPKHCTIILTTESLPPECGGSCPNCGVPGGPAGGGLPPGCQAMHPVPGSNVCQPQGPGREAITQAMMLAYVGWPTNTTRCETSRRGVEMCVTCTAGRCSGSASVPAVDPTIAQGSGSAAEVDAGEVEQSCSSSNCPILDSSTPQREHEFDPTEVEADPDPPADETIYVYGPGSESGGAVPPAGPGDPGPTEETQPTWDLNRLLRFLTDPLDVDRAADPVLLGEGSFVLGQTDLAFPGPVRPLEFRRAYVSQGDSRGVLGSNWTHGWDTRLERLWPDTAPGWSLPFCAGTDEQAACLFVHGAAGTSRIFFLDHKSGLYLPQAGSADTVAVAEGGGWILRRPDGGVLQFGEDGQLLQDRDRFGNGFSVEYEPTPLFRLYRHFCNPGALAAMGQDKRTGRCGLLSGLLGLAVLPPTSDAAWQVRASDYEPLPTDPAERLAVEYGRAQFLHLAGLGKGFRPAYGGLRLRPVRVSDDLGRSVTFAYNVARSLDFAAMPEADLLREVSGPAGTRVTFEYGRPPGYPARLNEMFLVRVSRHDTPSASDIVAAPARTTSFEYQWPGGRTPSYDANFYLPRVRRTYAAYFATFVGCEAAVSPCVGAVAPLGLASGDPQDMADAAAENFVSEVADNIISVVADGITESETRYILDPWAPGFGRVRAQRNGSSTAAAPPRPSPADDPSDGWATRLPKTIIVHAAAGPVSGSTGDRTDTLLPQEIRDRYPLETAPPAPARRPIVFVASDPSNPRSCRHDLFEGARQRLPEYRPLHAYYTASEPGVLAGGRLRRTRLACEQLAAAQLSDPLHNDLLSALQPVTDTPQDWDHVATAVVGRRDALAANANRICGWTRIQDRDGTMVYRGLNYRGQVVVDARQDENGAFVFAETIRNADGMTLEIRRPTRGTNAWSAAAGSTVHAYDEINPAGRGGADGWLPVFWARRMNLLRVEQRPAGGSVVDAVEGQPGMYEAGLGRYMRFEYEPLFNQVRLVERGTIAARSSGGGALARSLVPIERTRYVFDYEELDGAEGAPAERSIVPLLDALRPFGFNWFEREPPGTGYDMPRVLGWQLRRTLANRDLNGDGRLGGSFTAATEGRVLGLPIREIRTSETTSSRPRRVRSFAWAPNGLPAAILADDGADLRFEYFSIGGPGVPAEDVFGGDTPAQAAKLSVGNRGFLGRVQAFRFPRRIDAGGPPEAPCASLAGPYQWLLPATCSADPGAELRALGIPRDVAEAIAATADPGSPERRLEARYAYAASGAIRRMWAAAGETRITTDTDGRPVSVVDPRRSVRTVTYSLPGLPERETVRDAAGTVLADTSRRFDEEGRLTQECRAVDPGDCDPARPSAGARAIVLRLAYLPEGALHTSTGPEGLVTTYVSRDAYSRPLLVRRAHPSFPGQERWTRYRYDLDGAPTLVSRGGSPAAPRSPVVTETFAYDGLGRLRTHTDGRGQAWQSAHSARDLLTARRRHDEPYGPGPSGTQPSWETRIVYDAFGEPSRQIDNGFLTWATRRTPEMGTASVETAGSGPSYSVRSFTGATVWTRDALGNQAAWVWSGSRRMAAQIRLRRDPAGRIQATTTVSELDEADLPTRITLHAGGQERRFRTHRDGMGRPIEETGPDGRLVSYRRDLMGRPRSVSYQRDDARPPAADVVGLDYDRRGLLRLLVDPTGNQVQFSYDGFGLPESRQYPGQPAVTVTQRYDALGRMREWSNGGDRVEVERDERGDAVIDWIEVRGERVRLADREFDDLGRVRVSHYYNPRLDWLRQEDRTVRRQLRFDARGRVAADEVVVGQSTPHQVTSTWSIVPPDVWRREATVRTVLSSAGWTETYNPAERLGSREWPVGATGPPARAVFHWQGETYLGRTQTQAGTPSPFREAVTTDGFGFPRRWIFRAIDVDPRTGQASDPAEGARYCGPSWRVPECAAPLVAMDALRDRVGRIASLRWSFGHPVPSGAGGAPAQHPPVWRGYAYTPRSHLATLWENDGSNAPVVIPAGLETGLVTEADIQAIGAGSLRWDYDREAMVGGVTAITGPAGATRWRLTSPRGPGHQLRGVEVDGVARSVVHDSAGRISDDGLHQFRHDARGHLASVAAGGQVAEAYAYDEAGRLTAVFAGTASAPASIIVNDGERKVAGRDVQGRVLWRAHWGPGIDQPIAFEIAGRRIIPLLDHRGSVTGAWDEAAFRMLQTTDYDAEGRATVRDASGSIVCRDSQGSQSCLGLAGLPFGFASAWRSPASGLMHMRARWYSPELGQFLAHDPLGHVDGFNLYAYAGHDPVNFGDPFGLGTGGSAAAATPGITPQTGPPQAPPPVVVHPGIRVPFEGPGLGGGRLPQQPFQLPVRMPTTALPGTTPQAPFRAPLPPSLLARIAAALATAGAEVLPVVVFLWPATAHAPGPPGPDRLEMPAAPTAGPAVGEPSTVIPPYREPEVPRDPMADPQPPENAPLIAGRPGIAPRQMMQWGEYLDPFSNEWVTYHGVLQADHFIPDYLIRQMSGFSELTPRQQHEVLNHLGNFQPLPPELNASKGARLPSEWTSYKGEPFDPDYVREMARLEQVVLRDLQRLIDRLHGQPDVVPCPGCR